MPGHELFKLLLSHFHNLLLCPGPLVSAVQKPFVEQQKSLAFPDEALDLIRFPTTEHEKDILLKRVNIQLAAYAVTPQSNSHLMLLLFLRV